MESCLLDAGLKGDLRLDQALADAGPLLGAMREAHSTYMKLRESGTQQAYIVCSAKKNADPNAPVNPMMNKYVLLITRCPIINCTLSDYKFMSIFIQFFRVRWSSL